MGSRTSRTTCIVLDTSQLKETELSWTLLTAQAGGVLGASCASSVSGAEPVDDATIQWLRALISLRFDELAALEASLSQSSLLLSLCHAWAATHLDARFRSLEFLLGR